MVRFGIALGGGGAKGLAHVLMLEALDEIGLRPICVAGTSIGAAIGVLYCSGKSGREIRESILQMVPHAEDSLSEVLSTRHLFKWLEFIKPQFDGTGLLKAGRFVSLLFESIQATSFDQLAIPLRVVAADFWSREEVVLDRGLLRPAVQASMSLPGVFSPIVLGDRVLVDGGAVDPVPFDLLPPDCTLTAAVDVIGQRGHEEAGPPSLSEAIFNTFQIMEKSIVRAIGLSLVRGLVELHGGRVQPTARGCGREASSRFACPLSEVRSRHGRRRGTARRRRFVLLANAASSWWTTTEMPPIAS